VAFDPTVVTLPVVITSNFGAPGSVAGQTPFNVQLNCPSAAAGANLAITLATSNPVAGATGVIANTSGSGYAQNVGVQVLDRNGNPVSFGTAIPAGTVTAGSFNVQLGARYYQTGASVTAGQVKATATYTITYQ
jgi:type 1 fimbria pilin